MIEGGDFMKKHLRKPESMRTTAINKVRIMDARSSKSECTEPGKEFQGCQNPRGCGCQNC